MAYDPRERGALCDRCVLNRKQPVPPEDRTSPFALLNGRAIAIVGEAPGEQEERFGRPFVGDSGRLLDDALRKAGIRRSEALVTNAALCRPPDNEMKRLIERIQRVNRAEVEEAKREGRPPDLQLTPIECCRPRLLSELEPFENIITLGKSATRAVTGSDASIMTIRGSLLTFPATANTPERKILPTVHPAFVMRQMRWRHVFDSDLAKAGRWFRGETDWKPPEVIYHPSADQLRDFLYADTNELYAFDLETDGIEALTAKIRCIGIGTKDKVAVVGFLGKDGFTKFYRQSEEDSVRRVIMDFLVDDSRPKLSWNGGYYDLLVLQEQWGIRPRNMIDGIMLHRVAESELPHNLGYAASIYTDAPPWKCYDAETEVLTPRGWVRFQELKQGEKVAQWEDGAVSFVEPTAYTDQAYTGKMWRLLSQAVDLLVSPGHKMLFCSRHSSEIRVCPVEELPCAGVLPHAGLLQGGSWENLNSIYTTWWYNDTIREEVEYNGRIYCVSVPSGFILVRRNGKVTVSGNTDREGQKLSTDAESDEQLHLYNALDVAITARVTPPVIEQVHLRDQVSVWREDQKVQSACADMHTVGMYCDQEKRRKEEIRLLKRMNHLLTQIRDRLDRPQFNPASVLQLRTLLFEEWKLEVPEIEDDLDIRSGGRKSRGRVEYLTSSGDPSTADIVLRALLTDLTIAEDRREIIKLVRYYRKVQKVLGTYVVKLRPWDMEIESDLGWDADEDEDWLDRETRKKYGLKKRGIVNPKTGRFHPGWSAHVATTGRLSSSKPINAQNFPSGQKVMVTAAPGNLLVGADMDQLELRIAAALWKVRKYLLAFEEGKDPHSMTAFMVFGDAFCRAAGIDPKQFDRPGKLVGTGYNESGGFKLKTGEAFDIRRLSKQIQFASQYMAGDEMVHKLVQKTEVPAVDPKTGKPKDDGTTDLPYATIALRRVREMRARWLASAPEYEQGWKDSLETFNSKGYLREPIWGRRRDFLDSILEVQPNEIVNYSIQSSAAAIVNQAMIQIIEQIPMFKWGPGTGLVCNVHDFLMVECPADGVTFDGEGKPIGPKDAIPFQVAAIIEEAMNLTHPALPGVKLTASAGIAKEWKNV